MVYRIGGVLAVIAFAVTMSLRNELSSIAARAAVAAIAGGFAGIALVCLSRDHAAQRQRGQP
jgi:hypothetical protein